MLRWHRQCSSLRHLQLLQRRGWHLEQIGRLRAGRQRLLRLSCPVLCRLLLLLLHLQLHLLHLHHLLLLHLLHLNLLSLLLLYLLLV